LLNSAADTWLKVGYLPFQDLHLYRRSLIGSLPPEQPGIQEAAPDFDALGEIDRASFEPLWRSTPTALRESYRSTIRRAALATPSGPSPEGFAIVGCSGVTAYLQRIAVAPPHRGRGRGTNLVAAALRWAARHGAAAMLLNTPPANQAGAALYRSTGFRRLPDRLRVLRYG